MDRESARELFSDYLEGTLAADQRAQLEAYLEGNVQAQLELEGLRQTLASLSSLRPPTAPTGFSRKVERRIRLRSRGRFFSDRLLVRLPFEWFSFVIIMLLLTLYMLVILQSHHTEPASDAAPQKQAPSQPDPDIAPRTVP